MVTKSFGVPRAFTSGSTDPGTNTLYLSSNNNPTVASINMNSGALSEVHLGGSGAAQLASAIT